MSKDTDIGEESAHVRVDIFTESIQAQTEQMSSFHRCRQEDNVRSVRPGSRYRLSCRSSSTRLALCEQGETNPMNKENITSLVFVVAIKASTH